MNLITQREKEIKEVEKGCGKEFSSDKKDYCSYCKKEVELKEEGMPISGCYYVCEECGRGYEDTSKDGKGLVLYPNDICGKDNYFCPICKAKLQTLKRVLEEEKEFIKRLKEFEVQLSETDEDFNHGVRYAIQQLKKFIDNISIHNPQTKQPSQGHLSAEVSREVGEKSSLSRTNKTADNEPSGARIGSSNLCKNCGKPESEHPSSYYDKNSGNRIECKKFQSMEEKDERKNM